MRGRKPAMSALWKFIISPEFGDRLNLEKLTREMMDRVEHDLGTSLEWVAVPITTPVTGTHT